MGFLVLIGLATAVLLVGAVLGRVCRQGKAPGQLCHGGNPEMGVSMCMGQNKPTRGPQVLVFGSIYQGSILGAHF